MFDVIVIGAGIAGCACARELARWQTSVCVLEAGSDVACGTTKANSGIVHAGYDPAPGSLKAKYNIAGSRMYPKLAEELGFHFVNNGSLVVAFAEDELPMLEELLDRGRTNGVEGLEIIDHDALCSREPNLNETAIAALWVPTGAITNPYGVALAYAENAAENGVVFKMNTRVSAIDKNDDGFTLHCASDDTFESRVVIDAAGLSSGELSDLVSADRVRITPRAGEYMLLDTEYGDAFHSTIFQVPTAKGKGVLVTPTTGGNILIGPDAIERGSMDATETTGDGLTGVLASASKTWTHIPTRGIITNFAGLRASCLEHPDFILGEPEDAPGFFRIAGFDSPGLTAAPAVAVEYARTIAQRLNAKANPDFNPLHRATPRFASATDEERRELIDSDPAYGRIICRCECVSEAEIVAAIHSPVPAVTTDAIKWRTRAGMGRCQAGFCLPLVAQIIARETGCDVADVCKNSPDSQLAIGHRGCLDRLPSVVLPKDGERA